MRSKTLFILWGKSQKLEYINLSGARSAELIWIRKWALQQDFHDPSGKPDALRFLQISGAFDRKLKS
jgi:hypothetical protein